MLTYQTLTQHVVPGPQGASYFAPALLLAAALLIPRARLSRRASAALFLPPIAACTAHAWAQMGALDVLSTDLLLWSVFLLALHDPWRDFRRVRFERVDERREARDQSAEKDEGPRQSGVVEEYWPEISLLARLRWVGVLLVSMRLEGWKIGRAAHDRHQPIHPADCLSRKQYARRALVAIARGYLVLDLTSAFVARDAYFTRPDMAISSPLPPSLSAFDALPISPRTIRAAIIGAQAWALLSQLSHLGFLPLVAANALGAIPDSWSPHACRPFFGPGHAIFARGDGGLRSFWGRYWHQAMRHMVSGPGEAAADALGLRIGGLARGAVVSACAFALSGVVHMGLVPPRPPHATLSVGRVRLAVAAFFWLQPLGMLAEDLAVRAWRRGVVAVDGGGGVGSWRLRCLWLVKAVWLSVWFAACLPLLGDFGRQMGYWRNWLVPLSVWKGVRGEG